MQGLQLADIIFPLSSDEFVIQHWRAKTPFLGTANMSVLEVFADHPVLRNIETLLGHLDREIAIFGANYFRALVPAKSAMAFLDTGYNLYISDLERTLPALIEPFLGIARDLGVAPWQIHVEAFAGRAGGLTSRHFDNDFNIQILLSGQKRWIVERNVSITNPLHSFHPVRRSDGSFSGFREEAHVVGELPTAFSPAAVEFAATTGSTMFVPRGYWHEVHSLGDTWGINLVIRGLTWAEAFGRALEARLQRMPELRDYCGDLLYEREPLPGELRAIATRFEQLKVRAQDALSRITHDEVSLAGVPLRYRWSPRLTRCELAENRLLALGVLDESLELDSDVIPPLRRLLAFRSDFSWPDVQTVNPDRGTIELHNLLSELIELGLIEQL